MPIINETYRIYYVADNFQTELTDASLIILTPNSTKEGPFIMTEHPERTGVYYYDYTPIIDGQYYFEANSETAPNLYTEVINFESFSNVPYAGFDG